MSDFTRKLGNAIMAVRSLNATVCMVLWMPSPPLAGRIAMETARVIGFYACKVEKVPHV